MSIAGLVVLADRVQGIVRRPKPWGEPVPQWHEVPWQSNAPLDASVAALRATLGRVDRVHVAIGLAHLQVQQVTLPPASHDDRRRMIALDPSRWFAVDASAAWAVSLAPGDAVACASDAAWLDMVLAAAATWAPVESVEPAPVAMWRALSRSGTRFGTVEISAGADEAGLLTLADDRITLVRRAPLTMPSPADPLPAMIGPLPGEAATAWGATLGVRDDLSGALLTPPLEARWRSRARRRLATAVLAATASVVLLAQSIGIARERRLAWLDNEVAATKVQATPALQHVADAARLDHERALIADIVETRAPVMTPLSRLADLLPPGAVAQRVRMTGRDWQVDGSAPAASAVLSALAAESLFTNVRLLGPSARVTSGASPRETFSIGLVVR